MLDGRNARQDEYGVLPDEHPHLMLYRRVVPIWSEAKSPDDLDLVIREGYSCGFAVGFEQALITSNLLPERARGFFLALREYYLRSHTPADLLDWDDHAEETARAIPVSNAGFVSESREMKLALELPDHIDATAYRSGVRRIIMSKHTRKERL